MSGYHLRVQFPHHFSLSCMEKMIVFSDV